MATLIGNLRGPPGPPGPPGGGDGGGLAEVGPLAPADPEPGQLWLDTSRSQGPVLAWTATNPAQISHNTITCALPAWQPGDVAFAIGQHGLANLTGVTQTNAVAAGAWDFRSLSTGASPMGGGYLFTKTLAIGDGNPTFQVTPAAYSGIVWTVAGFRGANVALAEWAADTPVSASNVTSQRVNAVTAASGGRKSVIATAVNNSRSGAGVLDVIPGTGYTLAAQTPTAAQPNNWSATAAVMFRDNQGPGSIWPDPFTMTETGGAAGWGGTRPRSWHVLLESDWYPPALNVWDGSAWQLIGPYEPPAGP